MVETGFEESEGEMPCEGCGALLPPFLDACPYCDDDDEEETTLPCPECGVAVFDESQRCPHCGAWITTKVPTKTTSFNKMMILFVAVVFMLMALKLARIF